MLPWYKREFCRRSSHSQCTCASCGASRSVDHSSSPCSGSHALISSPESRRLKHFGRRDRQRAARSGEDESVGACVLCLMLSVAVNAMVYGMVYVMVYVMVWDLLPSPRLPPVSLRCGYRTMARRREDSDRWANEGFFKIFELPSEGSFPHCKRISDVCCWGAVPWSTRPSATRHELPSRDKLRTSSNERFSFPPPQEPESADFFSLASKSPAALSRLFLLAGPPETSSQVQCPSTAPAESCFFHGFESEF